MNHKFIIGYSLVFAEKEELETIFSSLWSNIESEVILVYDGHLPDFYPEDPSIHILTHYEERFEHNCNNTMIDYFMNKTDKDALIVLHEDMLIHTSSLLSDLDNLLTNETNIGFIGGRDGFNWGYTDMWSSPFSKSKYKYLLDIGQYQKVKLVNFGPVVYTRKTVEKIGKLDAESYVYAYADQDYALKAASHGLNNYVIGMDVIHEKFGSLDKVPKWCQNKAGEARIAKDFYNLNKRWRG
jgi:hypothetical protein